MAVAILRLEKSGGAERWGCSIKSKSGEAWKAIQYSREGKASSLPWSSPHVGPAPSVRMFWLMLNSGNRLLDMFVLAQLPQRGPDSSHTHSVPHHRATFPPLLTQARLIASWKIPLPSFSLVLSFVSYLMFKDSFISACVWACVYVYMYTVSTPPPSEVRRGNSVPWNWSLKWLLAAMWVLGTKPKSSARAASALKCWVLSPAPLTLSL